MKRLFIFFAIILTFNTLFSQNSNLIIFAENGEKFTLVLNGIQQNPIAETNVKVTDLNAPNYKARIIFEDKTKGILDKNIFFQEIGNENTFVVKQNKKLKYVLRFQSSVPLLQAPQTPPTQTVYTYTTEPRATTTVSQTTSTTVNNGNQGGSVGININDGETNVSLNLNINAGDMNGSATYSESTTVTTTTTENYGGNDVHQEVVYVPGYSGAIGCPMPMSVMDFENAKRTIASKDFEDSKLTIAKQIINSNCLLSSQVKQIAVLFDFEDTKLDFAKYAYNRTYDIGNYYMINDIFDFESSIDELNNYINAH